MRHLGLTIAGLRERAPERRVIEDRVVAEPAGPAGLGRDLAFDRAARFEQHLAVSDERERTHEAGRGLGLRSAQPGGGSPLRSQRVIYKSELLRIRRLLGAEPR